MNLKPKLEEMRKRCEASTKVVAWYAEPAEVRGPFCRWLTVSEVDSKYLHNVASRADDAAFAAMAMNNVLPLLDALEVCLGALEKEIQRQEKDDGGAFNYLNEALANVEAILLKVEK